MLTAAKKTTMPNNLDVVEYSEFDSPITFRIVDKEQHLIAKVNGQPNLEICKAMVEAFNQQEHLKRMCKKLILETLKTRELKGMFAEAVQLAIENENINALFTMLKDQSISAPLALANAIGKDLVDIIHIL